VSCPEHKKRDIKTKKRRKRKEEKKIGLFLGFAEKRKEKKLQH